MSQPKNRKVLLKLQNSLPSSLENDKQLKTRKAQESFVENQWLPTEERDEEEQKDRVEGNALIEKRERSICFKVGKLKIMLVIT